MSTNRTPTGELRGSGAGVRLLLLAACPVLAFAGPLEFGRSELNAALEARGLPPTRLRLITEVSADPKESFRIEGGRIFGGDLRGLMYGLLEAAEQIRSAGRLSNVRVHPAAAIRGVRVMLHSPHVGQAHTDEYWLAFIRMLARNRFNRLNVAFSSEFPYPYWLDVPLYLGVHTTGVTEERRSRNLQRLRFISQTAADQGIEFTLGIRHDSKPPSASSGIEGLTSENIRSYGYEALKTLLRTCPAIRGVQMQDSPEAAASPDQENAFYRDWVFPALRDTGRLVRLELSGGRASHPLAEAARVAGVPLRVSARHRPNGDQINLLEREQSSLAPEPVTPLPMINGLPKMPVLSRPYEFQWEVSVQRLFIWGDPEYVRRAVPMLTTSDTQGFEVDAPLAASATDWMVFTTANQNRIFWRHEFERYWLFYTLWGRLGYDPTTPDRVWMQELERRFGPAAPHVIDAYRYTSRVLNDIGSGEVDTGGSIDFYRQTNPAQGEFVAGFDEAVSNRVQGKASAKRAPVGTAARLHFLANHIQQALDNVRKSVAAHSPEWLSSSADFEVVANLAVYHARKQMAADGLATFDIAGGDSGLYAARRQLGSAATVWKLIVQLTDGIYTDIPLLGHWRDKLSELERDIASVEARLKMASGSDAAGGGTSGPSDPYSSTTHLHNWPEYVERPAIEHNAPVMFETGKPLTLFLRIVPAKRIHSVRLHYHPFGQYDKMRVVETDGRSSLAFTIEPNDLPVRHDLVYYFELLHDRYGGWFYPDPLTTRSEFVVRAAKP